MCESKSICKFSSCILQFLPFILSYEMNKNVVVVREAYTSNTSWDSCTDLQIHELVHLMITQLQKLQYIVSVLRRGMTEIGKLFDRTEYGWKTIVSVKSIHHCSLLGWFIPYRQNEDGVHTLYVYKVLSIAVWFWYGICVLGL